MRQAPKTIKELEENYYLKEELVAFARLLGVPHTGSKEDIKKNLTAFLSWREVVASRATRARGPKLRVIRADALIDANYSNDEIHREFFLDAIGARFKYNVAFMDWMKANKGSRTYGDAIEKWHEIDERRKGGAKADIGAQFEYNQYTRDFFKHNPGLGRSDCIRCWDHAKTKKGSHKYEAGDLEILG